MTVGVIPARYNSSRFPGKPLANILGKSLIQRTYENATQCSMLDDLVVATDDERIYNHVKELGGKVLMTSTTCQSGTDRVIEVVEKHYSGAEIVVNIQGDEPCLSPEVIDLLVEKLKTENEAVVSTPIAKINDPGEIFNPAVVKCVFDKNFKALYFSRALIPFPKNTQKIHDYYRHLGVYCFKKEFLLKYRELGFSRLQDIEDLEQLKILENGFPIHTCLVEDQGIGVDVPDDIKKLEELLCQENTSLLQEALSPL